MATFLKDPKKGARRQLKIAETAIQLIYSGGLDTFSFETLSQKCKVTRSLIYHYFPTLTDLLLFASAYIRHKYQLSVVQEMQKQKDLPSLFAAYVSTALRWVDDEPVESSVWLIYFYQ